MRPKVLHYLGGSPFGGATKVALNIAVIIQKIGFKSIVVTSDQKTSDLAKSLNLRVIRYDLNRKNGIIPNILRHAGVLLRILNNRSSFFAIHSHTTVWGAIARIVAKFTGTRSIHHIHNLFYYKPNPLIVKSCAWFIEYILAKFFSDHLIFIENEKFSKFNIRIKASIDLIPNGVRKLEWQSPKTSGCIVFGYIGRMEKSKNIELLMRTIDKIKPSASRKFLFAGDGSLSEVINQWSKNRKDVQVMGFTTKVDMFYNQIDVFINPSSYEGLSMSALEAMMYGKLVLITDITGNRGLCKNDYNGYLFQPNSEDSLLESINRINFKNLTDMSSNSWSLAQNFTTEEFNEKISKFYRNLVT